VTTPAPDDAEMQGDPPVGHRDVAEIEKHLIAAEGRNLELERELNQAHAEMERLKLAA
jgi:tRNA(Arg) A34 adenosine deaminase TadA